ncbi:MAG: exo-alpha-sialidase [Fimbriimonadaceae bacterium]|nr:exo-alpha-sialidase [Fimbriimonadaceae bacterium]
MRSALWLLLIGGGAAVVTSSVQQTKISNVLIAGSGGSMPPCEPSIAISQKDPSKIVAGVILDRALSSADGGKTWADQQITSTFGVHGDPTIISDADGNFYYFHLSNTGGDGWIDRIVCQKSTDGGKTWSKGAGIGHNPPADQDKHWAVAHPTKPWLYVTWTQFDKYGSRAPEHKSNIMFSKSEDAGETWSAAQRINEISGDCLDSDDTTEGAVPAVDADGNIYVAWSNQGKIFFDKSTDGGKTWMEKDKLAASHVGGWDMKIPGINRCNGMPVLVVDNSPGPHKGTLSILFADQRFGESDTDVFLIQSSDKGQTWSKPARVNQDKSGKQQFFPWIAIDQTTGYLYVVFYDRREHEGNETDVYLAWSTDGGKSFKERKISQSPFVPRQDRFIGDYNNISAHGGQIAAIWTRMDSGATTVWGAIMKHGELK